MGVDRTKYQIQIPLPPKIDPSVTMMTVEEKPDITYSDIGGCKEQIEKMREVVELPMLHPEKFVQLGIDPPKGVLCYGPPGGLRAGQQCRQAAAAACGAWDVSLLAAAECGSCAGAADCSAGRQQQQQHVLPWICLSARRCRIWQLCSCCFLREHLGRLRSPRSVYSRG